MSDFVVAALYHFVSIDRPANLKATVLSLCSQNNIKGTLLISEEGINGTIAGTRESVDALRDFLNADSRFSGITYKESFSKNMPFLRMRVRIKKEIVTLGVEGISPTKKVGTYVIPKDWNALIEQNDVVLVDTRNDYEVEIGTFKNAKDPKTDTFREFPKYVSQNLDPKKHKKVAMFCTGGIRCEKASSYMLEAGFEEVFHLRGGILKYLEEVPQEESLWEGDCFVFDQRVAVGHGLKESDYEACRGCRKPVSEADKSSDQYLRGVSCPSCYDQRSDTQKARYAERQRQMLIAKEKGHTHLGS